MNIKKRDAEVSIKKIIEAAKIVFAEKGFYKATLTEISKVSGLSRSTPSYFFKNKETLYKSVIEQLIQEEKDFVCQFQNEGPVTIESLKKLLAFHIKHTFENPYLSIIVIRESLNGSQQEWIREYFPNSLKWSISYLEEAQKNGIINQDIDIYSLWLSALSTSWLPIITQHTFMKAIGRDITDPDFLKFHQAQVERIIFEGLEN